jgi:hypothetical protein
VFSPDFHSQHNRKEFFDRNLMTYQTGKSIADLLSRLQFQKAYTTAPWLATTKRTIPPHLFNIESLKHRPCCILLSPTDRENFTITVGIFLTKNVLVR